MYGKVIEKMTKQYRTMLNWIYSEMLLKKLNWTIDLLMCVLLRLKFSNKIKTEKNIIYTIKRHGKRIIISCKTNQQT